MQINAQQIIGSTLEHGIAVVCLRAVSDNRLTLSLQGWLPFALFPDFAHQEINYTGPAMLALLQRF